MFQFGASDYDEYNSEELEILNQERRKNLGTKLKKYMDLYLGMTFKDIHEARHVINFYSVANKDIQWFKIKTLNPNHICDDAFCVQDI